MLRYSFLSESKNENEINDDTVINKIKIKKKDMMLKNIEKSFTNEKYDTSILENNKIQIIKY